MAQGPRSVPMEFRVIRGGLASNPDGADVDHSGANAQVCPNFLPTLDCVIIHVSTDMKKTPS